MDTPTRKLEATDPTVVETLTLPYRLGDYDLVSVVGHGGMGVVYRGRHRTLETDAAVKVLNPTIAHHPSARERFLQEARVTAALRHESVVRVVHVGEQGAVLYLVMELLEGESLATRLTHGPGPSMADAARLGREVASALAEAHRHDLVHRDVKPGNIFLERRDGGPPRAKLVDFGIARRGNADLTSLNALVGTPRYMAPEQVDDSHVGPPADVFSLGCVLYELAAGHNPFDGRSHAAVFRKIAEYDPPPLKTLRPDLPAAFSDLVRECLNKDPARRPTAKDVEARLAGVEADPNSLAWLGTRSGPAGPTEVCERPPARRSRRQWVAGGLAAVVGLVAVAVAGTAFWPSPDPAPQPVVSPRPPDKTQAVLTEWQMPDPPPLDAWLHGRRIRTVRKTGEAEFSGLAAAVAAVRPGEAIEILDAGPYTEFGKLADGSPGLVLPGDVGLFSRAGAVLHARECRVDATIPRRNGRACYNGPRMFAESGCRFHGLTFRADPPPADTADVSAWCLLAGGPCVVEDCLFVRPQAPRPEAHFKGLSLNFSPKRAAHLTLRRCWFEGTLNTHHVNPAVRAEGRVENCVLTDAAQNLWLHLANSRWAFVGNVFQAEDVCAAVGTTRHRPTAGQPELLFGRNTFLVRKRSPVRVERYEKGELAPIRASLFDNVFAGGEVAVHFSAPADDRDSRLWPADANWSSGKSGAEWLKIREGRIAFASQNVLDSAFGRITNAEATPGAGAIPPEPPAWLTALQERRRAVVR